ncbi:TetR/AcrR family transcriptional regulator [Acinetobacter gerneri]|uniref:TetR/AcrR family transcriptional regulator n=1 Tax=Acinetobacter gerneri TaxID=202952 RepID=UPI0028AA2CA3|nr:CerR family C-terminal domain-containing protein [Acinetobacter gerneri]
MGRANRSDGDVTKIKILEAAGELIAEKGFAKSSNKEIAQKAEVDLATINYHFGGRDGLHRAVISVAHKYYLDANELAKLAENDMPAEDKLNLFFTTILSKLSGKKNWYAQVFAQELLSPSLQLADFIQTEGFEKFHLIRKIVSQVAGIDENSPKILPCMVSIVTPCMMLVVAGQRLPHPNMFSPIMSMDSTALAEHFTKFCMAGLKATAMRNSHGSN